MGSFPISLAARWVSSTMDTPLPHSDGTVFRRSCTLVSLFLPQALRSVGRHRYALGLDSYPGVQSSDERWSAGRCPEHNMVNSCTGTCWRRRRGHRLAGMDDYVRDRRCAQSGKVVPGAEPHLGCLSRRGTGPRRSLQRYAKLSSLA